ncbi:NAD(P)H oxidoreductase [Glycomyces harbinensis]|uniref:Putative NADPH-quinone reductase (Modulator of drug activity B) n=1 Tax=Glycomyces harbinensis TaxID=58114 RepID=A0A1G7AG72_9ACTN|nr:NAD(P)H oxidoreductase [Glycomyces harbinensis]SDE13457.1 Putative NADPH-quinone reductase (modulator of drug activity B) [Glycomyces harbinensis]
MNRDLPAENEPTALVVVSHHRSDALTAAVAERAAKRLEGAGYRVDLLDLHAEGFDPRNSRADEPDYSNRDKVYTEEVHRHIARVHAADLVVPVFPVWWFGLPALMKGWFDRVWNHGLAYGRRESPMRGKRMLWLALAGLPEDDPNADLVRSLLDGTLRRGVSEYCGVMDTRTAVLYDSEAKGLAGAGRDRHYRELFARADAAIDDLVA